MPTKSPLLKYRIRLYEGYEFKWNTRNSCSSIDTRVVIENGTAPAGDARAHVCSFAFPKRTHNNILTEIHRFAGLVPRIAASYEAGVLKPGLEFEVRSLADYFLVFTEWRDAEFALQFTGVNSRHEGYLWMNHRSPPAAAGQWRRYTGFMAAKPGKAELRKEIDNDGKQEAVKDMTKEFVERWNEFMPALASDKQLEFFDREWDRLNDVVDDLAREECPAGDIETWVPDLAEHLLDDD